MSATTTLLRDYSATTTALAQRAGLDLLAAWGSIETFTDVSLVRELIGPTYYALIGQYGSAAAALAAVVAEEALGASVDTVSSAESMKAAEASLRWAMGPLYGPPDRIKPGDAVTLLDGTLTRHVLAPGRATMVRAATMAGVRYRRVLSGAKPCDFCTMLAGRGGVYHSDRSAGMLSRWHDGCNCDVVPDV